jgi:hypothetical protein
MHIIMERTEVIPCRIIVEHVACTVQRARSGDRRRLTGEGLRLGGDLLALIGHTLERLGNGHMLLRLGRR